MQNKANGGPNGVQARTGSRAQVAENGQDVDSNPQNGGFSEPEGTADALGKMQISKNQSLYVSSSHWAAILKDVRS